MTIRDRSRLHVLFHCGLVALLAAGMAPCTLADASSVQSQEAPDPVGRRVPAEISARLVLDGAGSGPMIRVLEGDRVTLQVVNPSDAGEARALQLPDPGGTDAPLASPPIAPGEKATVSFVARHPGLYLYRAVPAGQGFSGLLLVEPTYGFQHVDREFFLILGVGPESPAGEGAFTAPPGSRVRLFAGNPGAASASVNMTGNINRAGLVQHGLSHPLSETHIDLAAGGTATLELELGAVGEVELLARVGGQDASRSVLRVEEVQVVAEEPAGVPVVAGGLARTPELQAKIDAGKEVYGRTCVACHQATGLGIPGVYPPLAESDYLLADVDRAILGVIKGQQGEITVNGEKYNMFMPPQLLNDEEIAQVLTYVMHSFGNPGEDITVERVKGIREKAH